MTVSGNGLCISTWLGLIALVVNSSFAFNGHAATPPGNLLPKAKIGVPGWVMERMYHDGVKCPWLESEEQPDAACVERLKELQLIEDAIGTCENPLRHNIRVIGHRGAPLVAPEETFASWAIGAESGAGYLECDASVTKDLDFVCRHGTCDLHHTTDIIANHPDLNSKCTRPFVPGSGVDPSCCTYDFTVAEIQKLCALMDSESGNASASTMSGYWTGPPGFRSGSIARSKCHPVVLYSEYLDLMSRSGIHMIPELKDTVLDPLTKFLAKKDLTWEFLADKMANMLTERAIPTTWAAAVPPSIMQTFDHRVAEYWKKTRPHMAVEYMWKTVPPSGSNCSDTDVEDCGGKALLKYLHTLGVEMFSPPIQALLDPTPEHGISPSATAKMLQEMGVKAIGSWSLERDGCKQTSAQKQPAGASPCGVEQSGYYYNNLEGISVFQHLDVFRILDVLFREVKLESLFTDFPATVATYLNCIFEPDKANIQSSEAPPASTVVHV